MFDNQHTPQAPARPTAVLQRRGAERVQAILDAAEALLGEQGYGAATLKAIGERAGIPTASVYHYFADRHQVDAELLQRHVRQLDECLTEAVNETTLRTLRDGVDAVVSPMLDYFRQHPSCAELWFSARHEKLAEIVQAFDESKAEQFWNLLVEHELLDPETPQLALKLAFEAGGRLFDVAFQHSPTGDDSTIEEARRLVTAYLETYAPQAEESDG
ncbi:TetR/AcrR family transcriptional regulator [Saccharopolyspora sp. NPDC002686]|uniref:TetR/AcrR family transcriptional regulator n=1 Tax=Saccharopolyspora sp. NPDC002686 TaxID=3154541 RepID=UPI00331A15DD